MSGQERRHGKAEGVRDRPQELALADRVVSKNTNELKIGALGPFRSSSTRGEPQSWGSEAMSAIRVPRPVPKLGPFERELYTILAIYSLTSSCPLARISQ